MATNQSAERVLDMLEYLAETGRTGLGTMAQALGLNKSTAHRFASTLVKAGYVRQDPVDRTYSLTTRGVEIASQVIQRLQIHRVVHPVLDDLARAAGETVHLGILDDVENEEGIRCVGAPIRDHHGQVVAAVSISGWTVSMTEQRVQQLTPLLISHALRASEILGFQESGVHTA